jgi:hypothetical protein
VMMMSGESSGMLGNFLSLNSIATLNFSSIMSMCFYYIPTIQSAREGWRSWKKFSCSHSQNIVKVKWLKLKKFVNLQNTWEKKFHFVLLFGVLSLFLLLMAMMFNKVEIFLGLLNFTRPKLLGDIPSGNIYFFELFKKSKFRRKNSSLTFWVSFNFLKVKFKNLKSSSNFFIQVLCFLLISCPHMGWSQFSPTRAKIVVELLFKRNLTRLDFDKGSNSYSRTTNCNIFSLTLHRFSDRS